MFFLSKRTARQKYLEQVGRKYGHENVPFSRVYPHFEEVSSVAARGYSSLGKGLYGKPVSDDIVHLLKVYFVKGGRCVLKWGASLSFVPHQWDKELRWHRTLKSSHFDLFELSLDYFHTKHWRENEELVASHTNGAIHLREALTTLWGRVVSGVDEWFASASDIEGVLARAEEQRQRTWTEFRPWPDPEFISMCCLARLGRTDEAYSRLAEYRKQSDPDTKISANLERAIAQAHAHINA